MRNIQDNFETPKRSFMNAFLSCITLPLTLLSIRESMPTQVEKENACKNLVIVMMTNIIKLIMFYARMYI